MTTDTDPLRTRLRADLTAAMKARDKATVAVLRTTLAAFDNAEAAPAPAPGSTTSEHVAGASVGLGSAEVPRRLLTVDEEYDVLRAQIGEWTDQAHTYDALGRTDAADRLRREAEMLGTYLPQ